MIELDSKTDNYRLYKITANNMPKQTYVICSNFSREILYNPHIAGKDLQTKMEKLSPFFIDIATQKALKGRMIGDVVEFVLLAGGLYYFMARGFRELCNYALPQCFLGIKRQRIEGTEGKFKAVSTYENFESLPKDACVIIGDTIATGATMIRAGNELRRACNEIKGRIDKLIICSLACSAEGARRLKKLEDEMHKLNPEFELYLIVAEQLFHLMPDGTDLRFLGEDSLIPKETKEYTFERYGEFLGKEMKCAVFDWGTRCKNPKEHYLEFIEFSNEILSQEINEKTRDEINRMKEECSTYLKSLEKKI